MSIVIESELGLLNQAISRYQQLSGKTPEETMRKQGGKFALVLSQKLQTLKPEKGAIRAERMAALQSGWGVKVRESVREQVMAKYGARQEIDSRATVFGKRGVRSVMRKGGRRLNLQALMVQRELNLRESGRGFTAFSARFARLSEVKPGSRKKWLDRYSRYLASAGIAATNNSGTLEFSWGGGGSSDQAARSLQRPRAQAAIAAAIQDVRKDILKYVERKDRENAAKAFKK